MANEKMLWQKYLSANFPNSSKVVIERSETDGWGALTEVKVKLTENMLNISGTEYELEGLEIEEGFFILYTGLKRIRRKNNFKAVSQIAGALGSEGEGMSMLFDKLSQKSGGEPCYKWIFGDGLFAQFVLNEAEDGFDSTGKDYCFGNYEDLNYEDMQKHVRMKWRYWGKSVKAYYQDQNGEVLSDEPITVTTSDEELIVKFPDTPRFKNLQYLSDRMRAMLGQGSRSEKGILKIKLLAERQVLCKIDNPDMRRA